MGQRIDYSKITAEIKARVTLSDFFEKRGFEVVSAGGLRKKMRCPYHDEKTPSFSINDSLGYFHCFGCGKSGDLFTYLADKEGLPFVDAVESFAEKLNIPFIRQDDREDGSTPRTILRKILELVYKAFKNQYENLDDNHAAKRNLSDRHIPVSNDLGLFGWAGADDRRIVIALNKKGFTDKQICDAGVASMRKDGRCHLMWRDRLMFVIKDLSGSPIGFTGRVVYENDTDPRKYVNSSESRLFHKRSVMFCQDIARHQANKEKEVFVVEGQADVLACQHVGKMNTVASSGTAFTEEHASLLRRLVTPSGRIVFMFDADEAGQKAALSTFKSAPLIQSQAYATIPIGDKDASDMYRDDPLLLKKQLQDIHPLYHHVIDWLTTQNDLSSEGGRRAFINDCMDVYATIEDSILASNFITYVNLRSGMEVSQLRGFAQKSETSSQSKTNGTVLIDAGSDDLVPEDYALALAFEQPHLRTRLRDAEVSQRYLKARDAIADGIEKLPPKLEQRIMAALDSMRQFEGYSPIVDIDSLFDEQLEVLHQKHSMETVSEYHRRNISTISSLTSPENLKAYSDGLERTMEENLS